jgi:hypothetical protein
VYSLALAGLEEVGSDSTGRRLRFLTLTVAGTIEVPRCWTYFGSGLHLNEPRGRPCTPSRHRCSLVIVPPVGALAYRYAQWAFNRFIVAARRRWGRLIYFRVVEEQPRRRAPHLHLLIASQAYMPQRDLSDLAVRAGLGRSVWIRLVRSQKQAAGYLTTYVSKTGGADVPRGFHFYTRSLLWATLARAAYRSGAELRRDGATYAYVREGDAVVVADGLGLDLSPPQGADVAGQDRVAPKGSLDARHEVVTL